MTGDGRNRFAAEYSKWSLLTLAILTTPKVFFLPSGSVDSLRIANTVEGKHFIRREYRFEDL